MSKINHEKVNKMENVEQQRQPKISVYRTENGDPKLSVKGIITVDEFLFELKQIFAKNKITHLFSPNLYFKK